MRNELLGLVVLLAGCAPAVATVVAVIDGGGSSRRGGLVVPELTLADSGQTFFAGRARALVVGDIDGDLNDDFVVAHEDPTGCIFYTGDGAGAFTDTGVRLAESVVDGLALGDVDGDGDQDLVAAAFDGAQVWLNDGAGLFTDGGQRLVDPTSPASVSAVALADVDGDGDRDVVTAHQDTLAVFLNDGLATFTFHATRDRQATGTAAALQVFDLEPDGDLDVAVDVRLMGEAAVYVNDGTGVFEGVRSFGPAVTHVHADLDRDGIVDYLANDPSSFFQLWGADGEPTGPYTYFGPAPYGGNAMAAADLDRDGRVDVVHATPGEVLVYLQVGRAPSGPVLGLSARVPNGGGAGLVDVVPGSLVVRDFDGDRDLDVVFLLENARDPCRLFVNLGVRGR